MMMMRVIKWKWKGFISDLLVCHFLLYLCAVSEHNTLYIEVHCPVVRPDVVVISNSGQTVMDFGQVSVGQRVVKSLTVQNISDHVVEVSLLDWLHWVEFLLLTVSLVTLKAATPIKDQRSACQIRQCHSQSVTLTSPISFPIWHIYQYQPCCVRVSPQCYCDSVIVVIHFK